MKSICKADCNNCEYGKNNNCPGCNESKGCPFGKECFIAKYIKIGGKENYDLFKNKLVEEFNQLHIPGMPEIKELYPLNGAFVNLEYTMPNGLKTKLLEDESIYLGNQVECEFNDENTGKCYGLVANMDFLLICEYEENGASPEIVIYKKR